MTSCAAEAAQLADDGCNIVTYQEVFGDSLPDDRARYLLELAPEGGGVRWLTGDRLPMAMLAVGMVTFGLGLGPGVGAAGTGLVRAVLVISGLLVVSFLWIGRRGDPPALAELELEPHPARPGRELGVDLRVQTVAGLALRDVRLHWLMDGEEETPTVLDRLVAVRHRDCQSFQLMSRLVAPTLEHLPLEVPVTGAPSRLVVILNRQDAPSLRGEAMVPVMPPRAGAQVAGDDAGADDLWQFQGDTADPGPRLRRLLVPVLLVWLLAALWTAVGLTADRPAPGWRSAPTPAGDDLEPSPR